jgi:tetratricopeptide (TPR) repeat protein
MLAGNRVISWRSVGVALVAAALGWRTVRADSPTDPAPATLPAALPPSVQEATPLPSPGQSTTMGDSWRPRAKPAPPADSSTAPPANASDGWRPRVRRDPALAPAGHQQPAEKNDAASPRLPPPRTDDEAGVENIRTLPTLVGAQPKPKDQTKEDRAVLLSAARNAVKQGNLELAISRFEEYLRRFGDDADVQREYAGVLFSANRLSQAIQQYQRLLALQPDNVQLRMALGDIYLANKDYRTAAAEFHRILIRDPTNLEAATRLARAHALDEDLPKAREVFNEYLGRLQPGDDNVPRAFGALLIDLERPAVAARFLLALRDKQPDDLEVIADLVRAYLRLDEHDKALAMLEELKRKAPRAIPVRLMLADTLYQSSEYDIAGRIYADILKIDPNNGFAQVGAARVLVQQFDPTQARRVLADIKPAGPVARLYWLTRAEYHQLIGEYIEAKQIYGNFLDLNAADYEARLALAKLQAYVREYEKAKAEFTKIPPDSALGRKSRLGFAAALFDQRFFDQAAAMCQAFLTEYPLNGEAVALLVRSLAKMDQIDKAEALCRDFLQSNVTYESPSLAVRFAFARLLLDTGRLGDAAREYETLLDRPAARVPTAYYGLVRAVDRLGDHERARQILASITSLVGGDFRNRLLLADLFAADFDDPPAVEMCLAVLKWDRRNLAALIRLADSQQRLARLSGHREEAVQTAETILKLSPTNVRGHLALARTFGSTNAFKEGAAVYERLIALDTTFTVPQRERARVLFSDHQFRASAAAYQQMQVPSADELLHLDMASLACKEPRLHEPLDLLLKAELPGDVLRGENAKLAAGTPDPEVRAGLQRILADYEARSKEQLGAFLEGDAKSKKDFRSYAAIPAYQSLLDVEPTNEEGRFDLGQVYGLLKQNHNEIPVYNQLLSINPLHREGMVALERSSLELQPRFLVSGDVFAEQGRDGLARITRQRCQVWGFLPCGDENEFAALGFARVRYTPHDDPALDGNILSVRLQHKVGDRLLLLGQLNFEDFPDRLHDRFTFDAGAQYDFCDLVRGWTRAFLENVVENGESLRQDIHRVGWEAGADIRPTRYWDFGATGHVAYYSDVNTQGELYLFNNVLLTMPPKQLKFVLDADLQSFAQSTIFASPNHDDLRGTIHPYFSPRAFAYYEARMEWTHWLSRDWFVHSNQCYYSLQYANGWDSNLVNYNAARALVNCDVRPWLTIGADAQGIISDAYKAVGANVYLVVRLPCGCLRR